ncbi:hypothetical protein Tco_0502944 [Tanacetum coccineum]|uniref:Uncharacterized protein n=1 Tax=Tanacetum coccineum TaxID=301880 RepID=A0ABQ5FLG8_9ASTR
MTTPRPTPFSTTGPRTRVFTPFVIISDSDNEITTLPMRPAPPPSPDHTPALYVYPLDSGDDISDENLKKGDPNATRLQSSHGPIGDSPSSTTFNQSYHPHLVRIQTTLSSLPPSVPPPPEHIESLGDNIKASMWNFEKHPGP